MSLTDDFRLACLVWRSNCSNVDSSDLQCAAARDLLADEEVQDLFYSKAFECQQSIACVSTAAVLRSTTDVLIIARGSLLW